MNNELTSLAKRLRKQPTQSEQTLWQHLRLKQMAGLRFRRQQLIGDYVVDFVCFEKRLVIEVDGGQHSPERDQFRDRWLNGNGFKVLRFWNNEVLNNISGVLEVIKEAVSPPS